MSTPKQTAGNPLVHEPLPYLVGLKLVMSDDEVPRMQTIKVTAYSVIEAMFQAITQATGSAVIDDAKYSITSVQPDVAGWLADRAEDLEGP